jgi:hypothetical protein
MECTGGHFISQSMQSDADKSETDITYGPVRFEAASRTTAERRHGIYVGWVQSVSHV